MNIDKPVVLPQNSPLVSTSYRVCVDYLATLVYQDQVYANDTNEAIEAVYTFPVPLGAALLKASVIINGQTLSLGIKTRQDADALYEDAMFEGKAAYRIEQTTPTLYTLSVGNLDAGQKAEVSIVWGHINRWHKKSLKVRIPTTLVDRYGNPHDLGIEPAAVPSTSVFSQHRADVTFSVHNSLQLQTPDLYGSVFAYEETGSYQNYSASKVLMSGDFTVSIASQAALENKFYQLVDAQHARHFYMVQLFGEELPISKAEARNIVLVIDCSGSMMGASIAQAREGAAALLDWLNPDQRVNIVLFGSSPQLVLAEPMLATSSVISTLHQSVAEISADLGGTELLAAIELANQQARICGENTDIVLLTDGAVWADQKELKAAIKIPRLFTIGVGQAANDEALAYLSRESNGYAESSSGFNNIADVMRLQFQRISSGKSTDVSAVWSKATEAWQNKAKVFNGDSAFLFASEPSAVKQNKSAPSVFEVSTELPMRLATGELETHMETELLVQLIAHQRLQYLEHGEAEQWALDYSLVSDYTDLIVIDEASITTKGGLPNTAPVRHNVVRGVFDQSLAYGTVRCNSYAPSPACLRRVISDLEAAELQASYDAVEPLGLCDDSSQLTASDDAQVIFDLLNHAAVVSERLTNLALQNVDDDVIKAALLAAFKKLYPYRDLEATEIEEVSVSSSVLLAVQKIVRKHRLDKWFVEQW